MKIDIFFFFFFLKKKKKKKNDCRRPRWVAPAANLEQTIQKNPARRASKEALRRGSIKYIMIFMVRE